MAAYYGEPPRDTQFDTQTLEPPVRVAGERRGGGGGGGGEALSAGYYPPPAPEASNAYAAPEASSYVVGGAGVPDRSSGHTPMNSALETQRGSKSWRMPRYLVITSLILRAAAVVSLIVGIAVLASDSYTSIIPADIFIQDTYSFSSFSSTRYALAAAIIAALYSIYETVSVAVRLATGHPLLPGNTSLFISYIGDQVVIVLLLTGASAAAATFKDLHDLQENGISYCDVFDKLCKQGAAAIAILFLGFCFLAASLVISSFCFYKRKS